MKLEVELMDTLTGIVGNVLQPDECRALAQAVRDVVMAVRDHERGYVDPHEIGEAEDWLMELIGKAICNASTQCVANGDRPVGDNPYQPDPGAPGWERKSVLHETLTSVLGSTPEFARAVCNVLDGLGNDELERTSTQALAERVLAEHDRILKAEQAPVAP